MFDNVPIKLNKAQGSHQYTQPLSRDSLYCVSFRVVGILTNMGEITMLYDNLIVTAFFVRA